MLIHTPDKKFIATCDHCEIECGHEGQPAIHFELEPNIMLCTEDHNKYHGLNSSGKKIHSRFISSFLLD